MYLLCCLEVKYKSSNQISSNASVSPDMLDRPWCPLSLGCFYYTLSSPNPLDELFEEWFHAKNMMLIWASMLLALFGPKALYKKMHFRCLFLVRPLEWQKMYVQWASDGFSELFPAQILSMSLVKNMYARSRW